VPLAQRAANLPLAKMDLLVASRAPDLRMALTSPSLGDPRRCLFAPPQIPHFPITWFDVASEKGSNTRDRRSRKNVPLAHRTTAV
jgi:hypothetical protein